VNLSVKYQEGEKIYETQNLLVVGSLFYGAFQ
jgi:hypothetical protein